MTHRTCSADDCDRPHAARGLCSSHYSTWHRHTHGRTDPMFDRTCDICDTTWRTRRPKARFCSDQCKGAHYVLVNRTKSMLPADHPVIALIAENKRAEREARRKPKTAKLEWRTPRECPGCACTFSPLHTPNMVACSRRCMRRVERRKRRAREKGALGSWVWSDFMRIARKFDHCCAYCGTKPDRLDPDHVVPLSRGGYDSPSNLLPACAMCNSNKCAMTLNEWADWRERRGLPPLATSWEPEDRRYWHLTQAMCMDIHAAA